MTTAGLTWLPAAGRPDASPESQLSSLFFPQMMASACYLLLPRSMVSAVESVKPVHRRQGLCQLSRPPQEEGPADLPSHLALLPFSRVPSQAAASPLFTDEPFHFFNSTYLYGMAEVTSCPQSNPLLCVQTLQGLPSSAPCTLELETAI